MAVCLIGWIASGRSFQDIELSHEPSLQYWIVWGLTLLAIAYFVHSIVQIFISAKARNEFRKHIADTDSMDIIIPETGAEHRRFQLISMTAGITEEIIFRGFLISILTLYFPIWIAGIAATVLFVLLHSYQGISGMVKIIPVSVILAAMYAFSGSLLPASCFTPSLIAAQALCLAQLSATKTMMHWQWRPDTFYAWLR